MNKVVALDPRVVNGSLTTLHRSDIMKNNMRLGDEPSPSPSSKWRPEKEIDVVGTEEEEDDEEDEIDEETMY